MFPYLGPACNTLHVILLLYQNLVLLTNSQFCVGVCFSSQPKLHPHPPSLSKEEEEDTTTPPPHTCAIGHMQGTRTEVTVVPSSPLEKRTRPDILEQVIRLRPQEPSSPVSGGGKGVGQPRPFWVPLNQVDMVKEKKARKRKPKEKVKGGPKSTFDEEVWQRSTPKEYDMSTQAGCSAFWGAFHKEYNEGINLLVYPPKTKLQLRRKRKNDSRKLAHEH